MSDPSITPTTNGGYARDFFVTYVYHPMSCASQNTAKYFREHYDEFFAYSFGWTIGFTLCGLLSTQSVIGLSTVTRPILLGFGPGFAIGLMTGCVSVAKGFLMYRDETWRNRFTQIVQKHDFLVATTVAAYMVIAGALPLITGALTGGWIAFALVQRIAHYPTEALPDKAQIPDLVRRVGLLESKLDPLIKEMADLKTKVENLQRTLINIFQGAHAQLNATQ